MEIGYQSGSSYLICSDGVTDMLSDEELQKILDGTETAEEKVGKILEQALERGGRDNVTLVLAQISGYEEKNIQTLGRAPQYRTVINPGSKKRDKEKICDEKSNAGS